ncbi:MAG: SGNH/GDSL hydrolase family protein [bacterium]|nr:SGNH/GDSL hydrolase family protein [bacterium]
MRILIRGGSVSAGKGVNRSYIDILRSSLDRPNIEIINRSNEKDSSFDGVWSFAQDIEPFKPDILMLHFGIDDAYLPVYRSEFKENLVQIVRLARKKFNPEIILLTSHAFENQYDMDAINIYYRTIREVSVDLQCEMIPVHTYWAGCFLDNNEKPSGYLQNDTRYPNEKGHEIYAKVILQTLSRVLDI